ncbi:MAG: glycoside hydrolase family 113, partial [Owenweeksia sp.]
MYKLLILLFLSVASGCAQDKKPMVQQSSSTVFRGVNWVSPSQPVGPDSFDPLVALHSDWVAIIPYGFIRKGESRVYYNLEWQWWGERDAGVAAMTRDAKGHNLEVMLKPQVWIMDGDFTGDYDPGSEAGWQELEQSYYDYILHFALLADSLKCGAYCIGVEWKKFHQQRPQFWSMLIDSVRANYSGKVTYAGNWDSYQSFAHWHKLDYIGIDAYFPLSDAVTPTVQECKSGWQAWFGSIQKHQSEIGKPVVFTEFGYRSADHCAEKPWDSDHFEGVNLQAQKNAYQALFETFWDQPWFAGGFSWKWFPDHATAGG